MFLAFCAADGTRKVLLSGSAPSVEAGKSIIREECIDKIHQIYMIPANKIGSVIGKGGETIKSLQDRSGCKAFVTNDATNDMLVTPAEKPVNLIGSPQEIARVKEMINEVVFNCKPGDVVHVLQLPDYTCSMFIGKKAENVRFLQTSSGTNIFLDNAVGTPLRRAYVSGPAESVAYAFRLIVEQLGNCVINLTEHDNAMQAASYFGQMQPAQQEESLQQQQQQYVDINQQPQYQEQNNYQQQEEASQEQLPNQPPVGPLQAEPFLPAASGSTTSADYQGTMAAYYHYYGTLAEQNPAYASYYQMLQQQLQMQMAQQNPGYPTAPPQEFEHWSI